MLEAYTLMARKTKEQLEKAIATLLELLNVERDYLPALVCLSQARAPPAPRPLRPRPRGSLFVVMSTLVRRLSPLRMVMIPPTVPPPPLAQAYLMLKQSPKARNHLKRVAKMQVMIPPSSHAFSG